MRVYEKKKPYGGRKKDRYTNLKCPQVYDTVYNITLADAR